MRKQIETARYLRWSLTKHIRSLGDYLYVQIPTHGNRRFRNSIQTISSRTAHLVRTRRDVHCTLHVVGSANFQGITAGYTGSGLIRSQYGTTTTAAGTATIDLPVSTVAPNQMMTKIMISAVSTDGLKVAYATTVAAAFWNGTTTASSGTLPTITFTGTAAFAVTAALSISGNNLRLTVTGVASNNAVWVISTESYSSRNTTA